MGDHVDRTRYIASIRATLQQQQQPSDDVTKNASFEQNKKVGMSGTNTYSSFQAESVKLKLSSC